MVSIPFITSQLIRLALIHQHDTISLLILSTLRVFFLICQVILDRNAPIRRIAIQVPQITIIRTKIQNTENLRLTAGTHMAPAPIRIGLERKGKQVRVFLIPGQSLSLDQTAPLTVRRLFQLRIYSLIVRIDPGGRGETEAYFGLDRGAGGVFKFDDHFTGCVLPSGGSGACECILLRFPPAIAGRNCRGWKAYT